MDKESSIQSLSATLARFTGYVGKRLPTDIEQQLAALRRAETDPMATAIYDLMAENQALADRQDRPCCQDTGVIQYTVTAGARFPLLGELGDILREATQEASRQAPLRPNAVETFEERNTGTNVGTKVPWIDWEIVANDDSAIIDVYMAGGGCSLPGRAAVLMPSQGYEGIAEFVVDVVTGRGINACPPLLVGVGISASVDMAAKLSKRALHRPLDTPNANEKAAQMEKLLAAGLNAIGLGPQGLGGTASVLGVAIENSARHPSTLAVGVSTGCWAHRRGKIRINADMSYEIMSHRGAVL